MPTLAELIVPCGPTFDRSFADGVKERLEEVALEDGWPDLLTLAWPALKPVFGASPYLAHLARLRPLGLRQTLQTDPVDRLADLKDQVNALPFDLDRLAVGAALRRLKMDAHLFLALAELGGAWPVHRTMRALSEFADAVLNNALAHACRLARNNIAEGRAGGDNACDGLFIIGLGKLGGNELNFSSDVDIAVFYDPRRCQGSFNSNLKAFLLDVTNIFCELVQRRTVDGYVFRLDHRLRPDPPSTPLAVPVQQALAYYEARGQNWERAAYIKARPIAGDLAAARSFLRDLQPFIWRRSLDHRTLWHIQAIARELSVGKAQNDFMAAGADLKLGRGGIREIEFLVQTQQLIFGGQNAALRQSSTVDALTALATTGSLSLAAASALATRYLNLRRWEHCVQMVADEQTHRLPADKTSRRRIACLASCATLSQFDANVGQALRYVHRQFAKLFPDEEREAAGGRGLVFTGVDEDPATLQTLSEMGFVGGREVSRILRDWGRGAVRATATASGLEALTRLTPRLLKGAQRTGAPDEAFAGFSRFIAGLPAGAQALALLMANPGLLDSLLEVMALAPRLARLLATQPAALEALISVSGDLQDEGLPGSALELTMDKARRRHRDAALRIALEIAKGRLDGQAAGAAFTRLADEIITVMCDAVWAEIHRKASDIPGEVALIVLGKVGSREMTATSDLDMICVYSTTDRRLPEALKGETADVFFRRFTQRLVTALSAPTNEGELYQVDMRLRPSGTAGPVAVTLASFERYYQQEAEIWELLALTRARVAWGSTKDYKQEVDNVIGDLLRINRPRSVLSYQTNQMRLLIYQVHPPNGGLWDFKYTYGGLVDIEFATQFLQLVNAPLGKPLVGNTAETLGVYAELLPSDRTRLIRLERAWRLQQNLTQFLKVALEADDDPEHQTPGFLKLLARRGGASSIEDLRGKLVKMRASAYRDCQRIIGG